ncbi:MAG: hypothetical protein AB1505_11790 [Candidatus Latescibacterota bacterium]
MKRSTAIAALLGLGAASLCHGLELNFGGTYTRIPTQGTGPSPAQRRNLGFRLRSQVQGAHRRAEAAGQDLREVTSRFQVQSSF